MNCTTFIFTRPRIPRGHRFLPIVAALGLLIIGTWQVRAGDMPSKEYQVKAACIFNFTKFVDWPPAAFANDTAPITIGVLGDDGFGPLLDQLIAGETVHNRKLIVKRSKQLDDLKTCQVLWIGKSEQSRVPQILASLGDASILTVSEIQGFAAAGGIINFYLDDNKVHFEINPDAAKRRGINISPKLLALARIVR